MVVSAVHIRKIIPLLGKPRTLCFGVREVGDREKFITAAWNKTNINCFLQDLAHVNSTINLVIFSLSYNIHYEVFTQGLCVLRITRSVLLVIDWIYSVFL